LDSASMGVQALPLGSGMLEPTRFTKSDAASADSEIEIGAGCGGAAAAPLDEDAAPGVSIDPLAVASPSVRRVVGEHEAAGGM